MNGFCAEMTTPASRLGAQRPPKASRKRETQKPPCTFESSSVTPFQRMSQMGTNPPCFFLSLVCCCFVPARRKVGRGKGDGGGSVEEGRNCWLCLARNGPSSKGLVLKNGSGRVEKKPRCSVSQKESEQDFCVSFRHYPKCNYGFRKDHLYSTGFEEMNLKRISF